MTHAVPTRLGNIALQLRQPELGRSIARTATFNVAATAAAGLGSVLIARVLGPTVRGEYAAITAWFGIAVIIGQMGQPAALCYYVAKDPGRGSRYVATSRAMTLATGVVALVIGVALAPTLAHGVPTVTLGYRIVFATSIVAFVGVSYTSPLQARDLRRWNITRASQPILSAIAVAALWKFHMLDIETALWALTATITFQLALAYKCCRATGLAPGSPDLRLIRPLARYGFVQIAALTPATLNAQLDQLILSQTVPAADLGRYAVAVSLALIPLPLVSAIGYVAFPHLAARKALAYPQYRLQRIAVLSAAGLGTAIAVPIAVGAYWLVPVLLGASYRGSVLLLWILTPGTIFLSAGQVLGDLLRGNGRPIVVAKAQGTGAVFTVVLLLILLPVAGVYGAAIATTVAYGVAMAVMLRELWTISRPGSLEDEDPIIPKSIKDESTGRILRRHSKPHRHVHHFRLTLRSAYKKGSQCKRMPERRLACVLGMCLCSALRVVLAEGSSGTPKR